MKKSYFYKSLILIFFGCKMFVKNLRFATQSFKYFITLMHCILLYLSLNFIYDVKTRIWLLNKIYLQLKSITLEEQTKKSLIFVIFSTFYFNLRKISVF